MPRRRFISEKVAQQLLTIADRISQHPTSFDMNWWEHRDHCGTTRCIGGELCMMNNAPPCEANAISLLFEGATLSQPCAEDIADSLYYVALWPAAWRATYQSAPYNRAEVVAQYIRLWVAKHRPESAGG